LKRCKAITFLRKQKPRYLSPYVNYIPRRPFEYEYRCAEYEYEYEYECEYEYE